MPGFGFGAVRRGLGAAHGFSGNHRHYAERLSTGAAGDRRRRAAAAGRGAARARASRTQPVGLRLVRRRPRRAGPTVPPLAARPRRSTRPGPRPMTINVWEAVYFDHDLARLRDLADRAAALGVERYVLDDGWFRGRRDDHAGLGDWYGRRRRLARRPVTADRPRHGPRHGVRALVRARDGQRGQRPRPGAPRVDHADRRPPALAAARPAGAQPGHPRGVRARARAR